MLRQAAREDRELAPSLRPLQPDPAGEGGHLLQERPGLRPDPQAAQASAEKPGRGHLAAGCAPCSRRCTGTRLKVCVGCTNLVRARAQKVCLTLEAMPVRVVASSPVGLRRSEEHTSELQS